MLTAIPNRPRAQTANTLLSKVSAFLPHRLIPQPQQQGGRRRQKGELGEENKKKNIFTKFPEIKGEQVVIKHVLNCPWGKRIGKLEETSEKKGRKKDIYCTESHFALKNCLATSYNS